MRKLRIFRTNQKKEARSAKKPRLANRGFRAPTAAGAVLSAPVPPLFLLLRSLATLPRYARYGRRRLHPFRNPSRPRSARPRAIFGLRALNGKTLAALTLCKGKLPPLRRQEMRSPRGQVHPTSRGYLTRAKKKKESSEKNSLVAVTQTPTTSPRK